MCVMVYIGSNKQLPIIKWNVELPDFYVDELREYDNVYKDILRIMDKKYLYNIGAHTGCGCGFNYGTYELLDEDDIQEDLLGRISVNKLFNYIKENIDYNESIMMLSCLAGNEGISPNKVFQLSIEEFKLGDSFYFEDTSELRIIKGISN